MTTCLCFPLLRNALASDKSWGEVRGIWQGSGYKPSGGRREYQKSLCPVSVGSSVSALTSPQRLRRVRRESERGGPTHNPTVGQEHSPHLFCSLCPGGPSKDPLDTCLVAWKHVSCHCLKRRTDVLAQVTTVNSSVLGLCSASYPHACFILTTALWSRNQYCPRFHSRTLRPREV